MDLRSVRDLLDHQSGIVSRRQLLERGVSDVDIRRWVRRREVARVHTGVYVNHTGPLSWSSRAWAAVQFHSPAALTHDSVIHRAGDMIHVAIDASRTATVLPRVRVHRLVGLDHRVLWNLGPPRVRLEDALLSRCSEAQTRVEALVLVSDACRRSITTPARLASELARRPRVSHRAWLLAAGGRRRCPVAPRGLLPAPGGTSARAATPRPAAAPAHRGRRRLPRRAVPPLPAGRGARRTSGSRAEP